MVREEGFSVGTLSRREVLKAGFVAAALLLGTCASILNGRDWFGPEYWPFCHYPMFREVHPWASLTVPELRGVLSSGSEIRLGEPEHFSPFEATRLRYILNQTAASSKDSQHEVLAYLAQRYSQGRQEDRHSGPDIKALKLYIFVFHPEPNARNREAPARELLVAQWRL